MAVSTIKRINECRSADAILRLTDLTFENKGGWYRANADASSVFGNVTIKAVTIIFWTGTIGFAQLDTNGAVVQIVTPAAPISGSYWTVRAIIE